MTLLDAELVQLTSHATAAVLEEPAPRPRVVRKECLAPLPAGVKAKPNTPVRARRDLKTLAIFIRVYCDARHTGQAPVASKLLL